MRKSLLGLLVLAAFVAAFVAQAPVTAVAQKEKSKAEKAWQKEGKESRYDEEYTERDEFRQSYALGAGAKVRVSGINGSVDVETNNGSTAEVYVVRSARNRSDLDYHKVTVEQTASGLTIRSENDDNRENNNGEHNVRQRVTLKLPRSVEFTASGINGRATVGEIDGPVRLSGINGRAEVGLARGGADLSGINGSVLATVTQLGERGIHVSGINGGVELRLAGTINADVTVNGVNGGISSDLINVPVEREYGQSRVNSRIGAGGAPISVSGVNGSVRLVPVS